MIGAATAAEIAAEIAAIASRPGTGTSIPATAAADLVERHGLGSVVELALFALPVAAAMARPQISGYRVAAVGIEAVSGDLLLGANLEFAGSELTTTIHAEGFVALRARRRGRTLATLAVREARPCAHCRQTLAEVVAAGIGPADIREAWLAMTSGGPVDPEPGFRALLRAVSPGAAANVARWQSR